MPRRVLGGAKNTQDENSFPVFPIVDYMALVFVAAQAGAGIAEVAAEFRVLGEDRKAAFQIGHVAARAFGSEMDDGIAGDGLHIDEGVAG